MSNRDMAPGDREPEGRSMDDRSKMDRLRADGSEESIIDAKCRRSIRRSKQRGLQQQENVRSFESEPVKGSVAACRWKRSERGFIWMSVRMSEDRCSNTEHRSTSAAYEEVIGSVPKGIKKGSAACRWMERVDGCCDRCGGTREKKIRVSD